MGEAWIIDAVRTPRGRGKKDRARSRHPSAGAARAVPRTRCRRATASTRSDVEDVVAGCVTAVGEQGACIARNACSRGLAERRVDRRHAEPLLRLGPAGGELRGAWASMAGQQDLVIGGGVESMSRVPMGSDGGGLDGHNPHLRRAHPLVPQGISADLIATLEGFSATDLDRFARESQQRCASRAEGGPLRRAASSPVRDRRRHGRARPRRAPARRHDARVARQARAVVRGARRVRAEGRRRATLDRARAARATRRSARSSTCTTPGNSSGIVDGASAVLLASPSTRRRTASSRARASSRWRPPAPSRSSC